MASSGARFRAASLVESGRGRCRGCVSRVIQFICSPWGKPSRWSTAVVICVILAAVFSRMTPAGPPVEPCPTASSSWRPAGPRRILSEGQLWAPSTAAALRGVLPNDHRLHLLTHAEAIAAGLSGHGRTLCGALDPPCGPRVKRPLSGILYRLCRRWNHAVRTGNSENPAGNPRHTNRRTSPPQPPEPTRPPTPDEALMKLFLDNADRGANHANDELIAALRQRARETQALADLPGAGTTGEDDR